MNEKVVGIPHKNADCVPQPNSPTDETDDIDDFHHEFDDDTASDDDNNTEDTLGAAAAQAAISNGSTRIGASFFLARAAVKMIAFSRLRGVPLSKKGKILSKSRNWRRTRTYLRPHFKEKNLCSTFERCIFH